MEAFQIKKECDRPAGGNVVDVVLSKEGVPEQPLGSEGQHDVLEVWGELEPAERENFS